MAIRKKILLYVGLAGLTGSFAIVGAQGIFGSIVPTKQVRADDTQYTLLLNKNNTPAELTSSYQDNIATTVTTDLGNDINLNIVNGRSANNKFVELANRGMIYNFEYRSGSSEITGIQSITAVFSGSLSLKTVRFGQPGGVELNQAQTLSTGIAKNVEYSKYFQLIAGEGGASIESISISYTCATGYDVANLNGKYTAVDSNHITYQLTFNNGSAEYKSLNKVTPVSLDGSVALSSETAGTATFGSESYAFTVSADGQALTCTSASGEHMQSINFEKVYEVENFEQYTSTGTGWSSKNGATSQYTGTQVKGDWYCDYPGENTVPSPIGGSGWSLMGSDDYLVFSSNKGRNDSKAVSFKGNSNKLRYITMNSYYGVPQAIGKGTTFSFYAKGAYSNNTLTSPSTADSKVKVYAFYNSKVTSSNVTQRTEMEFTIPAGSNWAEYTMALDSSKVYYGFGFFCNNSSTVYTLIDDIKIYTHSPNVEPPVNYPTGTFYVEKSVTPNYTAFDVAIVISIGTEENQLIAMSVGNYGVNVQALTYNKSNNNFSFNTTGEIELLGNNYTIGTVTGTFDLENRKLLNVQCSGNIKNIMNNGTVLTLEVPNQVWDCDEDSGTLQTIFKRRWSNNPDGGGWNVDTTNSDRITSDRNTFVSGTGAVKLRPWQTGGAAINLQNDLSPAASIKNISYWIYNPGTASVTMRFWVYSGTDFGSNYKYVERSVPHGWNYYSEGCAVKSGNNYNPRTVYNFQFMVVQSDQYFVFDNITMF